MNEGPKEIVAQPGEGAGAEVAPRSSPDHVTSGDRTAVARQILNDALWRYRQPDGYEGNLVEAAWQLEQMGKDAWPALSELALSRLPECEFFLGAMVRIGGVPSEDRRSALLAAATNRDANVRSRLLELLGEMSHDLSRDVLPRLASPGQPEDSVTDQAREALVSQAP
jgi:hypothetical protein